MTNNELTDYIIKRLKTGKGKDFRDSEIAKKGWDTLLIGSGSDRIIMEWLNILREQSGKRIGYGYGIGRYAFYVLEEDKMAVRKTIDACLPGFEKYYTEFEASSIELKLDRKPMISWYNWYNDTLVLVGGAFKDIKRLKHYLGRAKENIPSDETIENWTSFEYACVSGWACQQALATDYPGIQSSFTAIQKPDFLK